MGIVLNGCSGMARLSHYAKHTEMLQKEEERQQQRFDKLKEALVTFDKTPLSEVIGLYGEPELYLTELSTKKVMYRQRFNPCSEKIYLTLDEQNRIVGHSIVYPCQFPQ